MTDKEIHCNETSVLLLNQLIKSTLKEKGDFADILFIMESLMVGVMLFQVRYFKQKPNVSSGLMEACLQRAIERFVEEMNPREPTKQ